MKHNGSTLIHQRYATSSTLSNVAVQRNWFVLISSATSTLITLVWGIQEQMVLYLCHLQWKLLLLLGIYHMLFYQIIIWQHPCKFHYSLLGVLELWFLRDSTSSLDSIFVCMSSILFQANRAIGLSEIAFPKCKNGVSKAKINHSVHPRVAWRRKALSKKALVGLSIRLLCISKCKISQLVIIQGENSD